MSAIRWSRRNMLSRCSRDVIMPSFTIVNGREGLNKTPAQAFTPPADENKMGTIWIFVYYAVYGSGRGRCRDFLVLKWGRGLNLQTWDLNRAHETERTVFPILQVFSMCRRKLWHKRKHKGYSTNSAMNTLWTQNTFTINKTCWQ